MSRRLLTVGLIAAALLAGRCEAKPPDLPLPQNDVLAPPAAEATAYVFPPAATPEAKSPLFFRVRPSVRRTMASCLLFGAHPLLALAPAGEYVDFDEEDAQPGTVQALFVSPAAEEPKKERPDTHDESTQSVCPYTRQQECEGERHADVAADIDLTQDVLHNLEMLRQAQTLLQTAQELGRSGQMCAALDCLELAHDLCPGSWLDRTIQEATAEVFAAAYGDSPQADGAAECRGKKKTAKEREIEQKLAQPVTMHFEEVPLREVIDDLRAEQGMNIYVDVQALDEEGVRVDQPVTVRLEDVSLQSALHVILNPARLTFVVKDEIVQITTKHAASGQPVQNSGATEDAVRPCLPPVDSEVPAILDHLYPETTCPARPECGGEEQEPPADPKEEGVKNAPAPMSYLDMLDNGELSIGLDGSVRMFTQFRRGGSVWHLRYDNGGLSVWASPDGGADTPSPTENPPDGDSAD